VPFQKNGSLATSTLDFLAWSNWIDNYFHSECSQVVSNTFNEGLSITKANIEHTTEVFVVDLEVPGMKTNRF